MISWPTMRYGCQAAAEELQSSPLLCSHGEGRFHASSVDGSNVCLSRQLGGQTDIAVNKAILSSPLGRVDVTGGRISARFNSGPQGGDSPGADRRGYPGATPTGRWQARSLAVSISRPDRTRPCWVRRPSAAAGGLTWSRARATPY